MVFAAAAAVVVGGVVGVVVVVVVVDSCFFKTLSIFAVIQHVCLLSSSMFHIPPTTLFFLPLISRPFFLQVRLRNDAWTTKNEHYGKFVDCMQAMTPPDFTHHAPSCARQPSVPVKHKSTPAHWSAHVEFQVSA